MLLRNKYVFYLRSGKVAQIDGIECKCVDSKNGIYHVMDKDDDETMTLRKVAIITDPDLIQILKP